MIATLSLSSPAIANNVMIKNNRGEKVKLCTYRSDDKSAVRPRKCWMLKNRQSARWDRGPDESNFDVRIFGPGIFELPICLKRNLGNAVQIDIVPSGTRNCVQTIGRRAVPEQKWVEGSAVLVNRSDDEYWYPAFVTGRQGDEYKVMFANGRRTIGVARYITADTIRPGLTIEVNWKNQGRWYPVKVAMRQQDKITVTYDDGKTERAELALIRVSSDDLMKLDQP